jgi:hypothetical protein
MKRRATRAPMKSTQKQHHGHPHPHVSQEVDEFALAVMSELIERGGTADINDIIYDLGVRAEKDPHSWEVADKAVGYLKVSGVIEAVTFCEHECLHEVRAVALFPVLPIINADRVVQGLAHIKCALDAGLKPDRDPETGVILGFYEATP